MWERQFDEVDVRARVDQAITLLAGRLEPALRPPIPPVLHSWTVDATPFVVVPWPVRLSLITGWQFNPFGGWAFTTTPRVAELSVDDLKRNVPRWEQPATLLTRGDDAMAYDGVFLRVACGLLTTVYRRRSTDGPARRAM